MNSAALAGHSLIAASLAMDCMAVSLSVGLGTRKGRIPLAMRLALVFGAFQAGMFLIGYGVALGFRDWITGVDHWLAFVLLGLIGAKMVKEGWQGKEEASENPAQQLGWGKTFTLGIATSIDALAVGAGLALVEASPLQPSVLVGAFSFFLALIAFFLGTRLGRAFGPRAEMVGGLVLIGIGVKILFDHMA